jgi:hypothetical protein
LLEDSVIDVSHGLADVLQSFELRNTQKWRIRQWIIIFAQFLQIICDCLTDGRSNRGSLSKQWHFFERSRSNCIAH